MNIYNLDIKSNNMGVYFGSEQLEMLTIVQCQTYAELISFIKNCWQLKGIYSEEDFEKFKTQNLEQLKRKVFKSYQDTLVAHNSVKEVVLDNALAHLNIKREDALVIKRAYNNKNDEIIQYIREYIKNRYPKNYEEIFKQAHRFVSLERDQNKISNLYDEFVLINNNLNLFNTLLIGSGKPEVVINEFMEQENKFDFYFVKRDLDYALKNNKHVRLHSLLTKGATESLFTNKSKEEILKTLSAYVKEMIDFINEYNSNHKLSDGTPVIQAVDLFNEIVSFDKNKQGEYENIWLTKYGITFQDICDVFKYAKEHKHEGVSYLYNEPFLEDSKRREKVLAVLQSINSLSNNLIDTLGSQMHITFGTSNEQIQDCFNDFKKLQETYGLKIQITEFDLSLGERETLKTIGDNPQISYDEVYAAKKERIEMISNIINNSQVKLSGVSYWSLTDNIDCNLERVRTNLLKKGIINNINQVPTVCGGLIPTYKNNTLIMDDAIYKK